MKKLEIEIDKKTLLELQEGGTTKLSKIILETERKIELTKAKEIKEEVSKQIRGIGEGSITQTVPIIKEITLGATHYFYHKNDVWMNCDPGSYLISIKEWNNFSRIGFSFERLIEIADPEIKNPVKIYFEEKAIDFNKTKTIEVEKTQIESEEEEWLTKRIKELLKDRIKKIKYEIHNTTIKEDIPKIITDYSDQFFTIHHGTVILDATFIGKKYDKEYVLLIYAPTNKNQIRDLAPVMGDLVDITGLDFNKPWKDAEPGYVILTMNDWERIVKDFNKYYWDIYNYGDEKTRIKCKIIQMEVNKETVNTETQKEWVQDLLKSSPVMSTKSPITGARSLI